MNPKFTLTTLALIASLAVSGLAGTAKISQKDFGDAWPFTVAEGVLSCTPQGDLHVITFAANGKTYAINGTARNLAKKKGWADVETIWKDDASGLKADISPIIEKGKTLCK